jgi:sulfur carrier protein ThiS
VIRVAGQEHPWRPGLTVEALLGELGGDAPGCPVVRVDDEYVSRPNFAKTIVPEDAEVFLIPMISGG